MEVLVGDKKPGPKVVQRGSFVRWLLIDRLLTCDPGKSAVGLKAFTRAELFFMDHFPGRAQVPGALQLEMIAQTAGRCIRIARPGVLTLLSRVHSARFLKPIVPGDQCHITVQIIKLRSQYAIASGILEVAGEQVAEAEVMYALVDHKQPDQLNQADPVIEEWAKSQGEISEPNVVENGFAAIG
jgi:3-hydroxyacyl-[acyl-carrier-protein] dehydratase